MAQQTSISPAQPITIDGEIYRVRTVTVWNDKGTSGTIDDKVKPIIKTQYQEEGVLSQWKDLADRTDNKSVNNGWSFRPSAGQGFKEALVKSGSNSLTSQLDNAAVNQVAKDAKVPTTRAKQVLSTTALTQQNKALAATSQDPTAPARGSNVAQQGGTEQIKLEDLQKAVGKSSKSRTAFPQNLKYPLDLEKSNQDKMKFEMVEYRAATFTSNKTQFGFDRPSDRPTSKIIGSVYLPIPSGISDTTSSKWGEQEADAAKIAAANVAMGGITGGGEEFTNRISEVIGGVQSNSGGVKTGIAAQIAGEASGIGGGLLTRLTGAVLNPNLELLFGGPTLRPFNFTFKMSARSEAEAKQIIGIIRFFKQGMAPQKSDSNLFLKSPHTFKIKYLHQNKEHKFLNKFKECALQSLTVNYTPEGQYATFYDGPMVSYEISMQFQELEPIFNEDYGPGTGSGGPDTELGF